MIVKNICNTIIGYFIIAFLVFRLFVLVREPYKIDGTLSWVRFFIVTLIFITCLLTLYKTIRKLLNNKYNYTSLFYQKIVHHFVYVPLTTIRNNSLKYNLIQRFTLHFAKVLESAVQTKKAVYLAIYTYFIIPRKILCIALLADVLLFNQINIFFNTLWVMVLPLTAQIILSYVNSYITQCKEKIQNGILEVTFNEHTNNFTLSSKENLSLEEFQNYAQIWLFYCNVLDATNALLNYPTYKFYLLSLLGTTVLLAFAWFVYIYIVATLSLYAMQTNPTTLQMLLILIKYLLPC